MIRPVILCGGAGTRLWPLSRQLFPKQLLALTGEQSLLQQTALRLANEEFEPAIVVSGENQWFFIKRQLDEVGTRLAGILLEPTQRNTSAAAALAATWIESTGRDELLLLVPSDHVILDQSAFLKAINLGTPHAERGAIVTFGAQPTEPNTQYGYIEAAAGSKAGNSVFPIARFVEKPDAEKAAAYLASGNFYWNAGIFLLKASTLIDEMRRFLPESLEAIRGAITNATSEGVFVRPEAGAFSRAVNISIDNGIMEKTSRGVVVPVQMDWSDVGSWEAVWKLGHKDSNDNVAEGDVMAVDTRSSLIRSEPGGPLVATVGLNQMAVIATADAVFVAPLDRVSDVKYAVDLLRAEDRECVVSPPKVAQPWGSYECVAKYSRCTIGYLVVDVNEKVQRLTRMSEHWLLVRGSAEITTADQASLLGENESIYFPAGREYCLKNIGTVPLELIEIKLKRDADVQLPTDKCAW